MPRQKRKQAPASDFSRASKKLGSKKTASNWTDTSISQTQLQVPHQVSSQGLTSRGLSFSALLSRSDHHNASNRASALNGLSNAVMQRTSEAHLSAVRNPTLLLHISARGSRDEVSGVRSSARGLLHAVLQGVPREAVGTLLPMVRAGIVAGLSHVRTDVRKDAVKSIVMIGEVLPGGWVIEDAQERSVRGVFAGLVQAVRTRPVGVHVMKAVNVCVRRVEEVGVEERGRFYYQKRRRMGRYQEILPEKEVKELQKALVEVVLECRGKGMIGCAGLEALVGVIEMSEIVEECVKRVVGMGKIEGEGKIGLGRILMKIGQVKEAGEMICEVLDEGGWGDSVEMVLKDVLMYGDEEIRRMVGKSWIKGWEIKGKKNDEKSLKMGMKVLKIVLKKGMVVRECIEIMGKLVRIGIDDKMVEDMIDLIRMICEKEKGLEESVQGFLQVGCDIEIWKKFQNEQVNKKMIGLGYVCGKMFCDEMVKAILWSEQNGREETVKSFVDAIESEISMRNGRWYEDMIGLSKIVKFDMTRSMKMIEKDITHVHIT